MKIRSEILELSKAIRSSVKSYNGGDEILIEDKPITIQELSLKIRDLLSDYEKNEGSLKGRIDTCSHLSNSLMELKTMVDSSSSSIFDFFSRTRTPDYLSQILEDISIVINSSDKKTVFKNLQESFNTNILNEINLSLFESIKQNSYRSLNKNNWKNLNHAVRQSPSFPGYLHLKKDIEKFLETNQDRIPGPQRSKFQELIPLLEKGYEIDKMISYLYKTSTLRDDPPKPQDDTLDPNSNEKMKALLNEAMKSPLADDLNNIERSVRELAKIHGIQVDAPDSNPDKNDALLKARLNEAMEALLADILYEIENSVDNLAVGQKFIFPGGIENNRYVLFEIQRLNDKEYQFAIINTGTDAEVGQDHWHWLLLKMGLSKQAKTLVFNNLPKEALTDLSFLTDLVQMRPKTEIPTLEESVYKTIFHQLTEKYPGKKSTRGFHEVQPLGPTSFDPVLAYIEYTLPPNLFLPFQFHMMLRARADLSDKLPQGRIQNTFPTEILDLIDQKSCESIARWKKTFDRHCQTALKERFPEEDLVSFANVENREAFVEFLNGLQEDLIAGQGRDWYLGLLAASSMIFGGIQGVRSKISPGNPAIDAAKIFLPSLITAWFLFNNESVTYKYERDLQSFQNLLKKTSPSEHALLVNRNQIFAWTPEAPNDRADFSKIALDSVLEFLTDKMFDAALCTAPTFSDSPGTLLNGALQGCNTLYVS